MRKICLVTTTRAEYGIMSRLIDLLQNDEDVTFSLIASGTHLSTRFGMTVSELEGKGVHITRKIDIGLDSFPDGAQAEVMACALVRFTEAFKELRPDIVILLGDRYEMMAVAMACTLCCIPIAHLHGGETTEGATDEVFRHSITKASHLHFTSCEAYRQRVIQLGESPDRVFNVGALGVENARKIPLLDRKSLEESLGITFRKRILAVTFHPESFSPGAAEHQMSELVSALEEQTDCTIIITRPNADAENVVINEKIDSFVARCDAAHAYTSLGMLRYLSLLSISDAVVGNSSSGIIEAPSFGCATVNIGDRQKGRIQAASVINCRADRNEILASLEKAYSAEFRKNIATALNPYEGKDTAERILSIVKSFPLDSIAQKTFYDIEVTHGC